MKNGTPASPATALASSVLPVPGGPTSSTPLGAVPPSRVYLDGALEKVDNLDELNSFGFVDAGHVVEGVPGELARLEALGPGSDPCWNTPPPACEVARLVSQRTPAISSRIGPKLNSRLVHHEVGSLHRASVDDHPMRLQQGLQTWLHGRRVRPC